MYSALTQGIHIIAEAHYQETESKPAMQVYLHAYRITIENTGVHPVKLLSRHWQIFDSATGWREVKGEGVVGQQPIIDAGASYQYTSGCQLQSELGFMLGTYTFESKYNGQLFEAIIPKFFLFAPQKFN